MLNMNYEELRNIDVKPYVKKRDGADYLPWTVCKELLHKNGAEKVYFIPVKSASGSSLFASDIVFEDKNGIKNRCYEVEVEIHIDDLIFNMRSPVMNGANPVKDNSMSQQRVWNAQTRAFVKGVAIYTGLGYDLWLGGDLDEGTEEENLQKHSLEKIKQRFQETYTGLLVKGLSASEIAEKLQMTVEEVKAVFAQFDTLQRFEERLKSI